MPLLLKPSGSLLLLWLFATSTFLGAALLFQLEPFVGKSLLPWYGGAPSVWNSCVFFFQWVLLLGYLYAHLLHRYLPLSRQWVVHVALMLAALMTLPIEFDVAGLNGTVTHPEARLLADLWRSIGLVFFVVSTTAPLMQAWYAAACPQGNPYLLYVSSNTGSLVGLLAYPVVVEFWLPLSSQAQLLTWSFVGLVGLFVVALVLYVYWDSLVRWTADDHNDEAVMWLYATDIAPGGTIEGRVEVEAGLKLAIRRVVVTGAGEEQVIPGHDVTWGELISTRFVPWSNTG